MEKVQGGPPCGYYCVVCYGLGHKFCPASNPPIVTDPIED